MSARKTASEKPSRIKRPKRTVEMGNVFTLPIPPQRSFANSPLTSSKPQVTVVFDAADNDDIEDGTHGKNTRLERNPWLPTDIVVLMKFVCVYPAAKAMKELIKMWMEYRKAQKIEIKVGDNELKIEGSVSDRTLQKRIESFRKLIKGATADDIQVILPKGANRRIPSDKPIKKSGR